MDTNLKIAIYTCITGNYDKLALPTSVDNRFDYFCFSDDSNNVVAPWVFKPIDLPDLDNKDKQRYIKIHVNQFFPEYDSTIYMDGKIQITGELYDFFISIYNLPYCLSAFTHTERSCIYSEGAACSYYSHDWIWNIAAQMREYSSNDFPLNEGLMDTYVLFRKNTPQTDLLMDAWWLAYLKGVKRDQLSLSYVAWKHEIPIHYLGHIDSHYFKISIHAVKRTRSIKISLRKYINRAIAFLIPYHVLFSIPSKISRKKPFQSI
jgi:hypothetical protein